MKVPNDEEIANHIVPESCAAYREVRREALTGVHIGQNLSREMDITPSADAVPVAQGYTAVRDKRESPCATNSSQATNGGQQTCTENVQRMMQRPSRRLGSKSIWRM